MDKNFVCSVGWTATISLLPAMSGRLPLSQGLTACLKTICMHLPGNILFFNYYYFTFVCIDILPAYTSVYHMCPWCLRGSERALDPLELELTNVTWQLKLPCGCWGSNPGVLGERGALDYWAISPGHESHLRCQLFVVTHIFKPSTQTLERQRQAELWAWG